MLKPLPLYLLQERVRGGACSAPHQQHSRWKLRYLFLCCGGAARHQLRSVEITGANGGLRGMHGETLLIFPGRRSSFPHFQKWHNCFESVFFRVLAVLTFSFPQGDVPHFPIFKIGITVLSLFFQVLAGLTLLISPGWRSSFPQGDALHFFFECVFFWVQAGFPFKFLPENIAKAARKTFANSLSSGR